MTYWPTRSRPSRSRAWSALEALPAEPDDAAAALRNIRQVSTSALAELRSAVGVLRDPAAEPLAPVGGWPTGPIGGNCGGSGVQVAVSDRRNPRTAFRWSSMRRRTGSSRNRSPTCCGTPARCGSRCQIDCRPREVRLRISQSRWRRAVATRERTSQRCKGFRHRRDAGAGGVAGRGGARRPHRGRRVRGDSSLAVPGIGPVRRADRRAAFLPVRAGAAADPIASARRAIVISVVIVDDQHLVRAGVRALLERAPDIEVVGEASGRRVGVACRRAVSGRTWC